MPYFQLLRDKLKALPVFGIIDAVVRDVIAGLVTVVAASTGSGKSMLLPGALADATGEQVVVLVPRRFLATDAAYNVAELASIPIGEQVGYALGQMDGESSQRSAHTKVLYCTYGYALSSGLINRARTIVLDEVHEADELISLARAVLRERKDKDPSLRILEMSATIAADTQARYWHPIAKNAVHSVEGQRLACDVMHESPAKERTAQDVALALLEEGRKGIAVFRPGVREVETAVVELKEKLMAQGITNVEVAAIHGGTPADERHLARNPPAPGNRKIIVGTNVIESGVNLRWVDAGVSDGYRKIPYHRDDSGADALIREDQPQAGLLQQIGRINRDPVATGFESGKFILFSKKSFDNRIQQNGPAIQRQSLLGISFYATCLGYDPTHLTWDINSLVHSNLLPQRFEQAKQDLIGLRLVNEDWSLTKDGLFIKNLPVSPETGAMLCEAKRVDEQRMRNKQSPRAIRDAVIIAAIIESHGLRNDARKNHKADQHRTSDLIDAMNAYRIIRKEPVAESVMAATESVLTNATQEDLDTVHKQRLELQKLCEKNNVSLNGFVEVGRLADEIASRLGEKDKGIRVDVRVADDKYDAQRYGELQRCILCGGVNRLFQFEEGGLRDLVRDYGKHRRDNGELFRDYKLSSASIVKSLDPGTLVVGHLREFPPNKESESEFLALTEITVIPAEVFVDWAVDRAKAYDPALTKVVLNPNGTLEAVYAETTNMEMTLPALLCEKIRDFIL